MKRCKETCGGIQCVLRKNHDKAHQNDFGTIKWENFKATDQGFITKQWGHLHDPREGDTNFYSTGSVPKGYECSQCGAKGCKLWRQTNTLASNIELMCGTCSLKDQKKEGNIDKQGYIYDNDINLRCCQIGWLVPAVPCEEEDTFWGFSSVPTEGVNWWSGLPSKP